MGRKEIVEFLNTNSGWFSVKELSESLDISRQAIKKTLRRLGLEIEMCQIKLNKGPGGPTNFYRIKI